jgi:hypothetical protein
VTDLYETGARGVDLNAVECFQVVIRSTNQLAIHVNVANSQQHQRSYRNIDLNLPIMLGRIRSQKLFKSISDPHNSNAGEDHTDRRLPTANRSIGIGNLAEPIDTPAALTSWKCVDPYNVLFYNGNSGIR